MSKPPLWEVMRRAYDVSSPVPVDANLDWIDRHCYAGEIRALRDWLVPEEKQPPQRADIGGWNSWHDKLCWDERQRLRALLTSEADRAEWGEAQQ